MEIKVKLVGEDSWGRDVFQNVETKKYYKRYKKEITFYTASGFEGEPDIPLREDVKVTIVP